MTEKWKHIRPSEYDWDYFKDVNGRETSMVRTLITGDEYIWEASLRPNYVAESHWHMILCKYFLKENLLQKVKDLFILEMFDG